MRPLRLELQGFTAFHTLQTVDFTKLDLFVITGPTGAGKTSLLDAMALALYGAVPRIGTQGLSELVSHGQAEARVLLEFAVGGDTYRVARRLPRKGSQSAKFERLVAERWVDVPEKSGVLAVNAAIRECVVLDFESFCKAVVLPQGEFARFLKGDPAERRKAVVTLLGLGIYERMGKLARDRAKDLRLKGEAVRNVLDNQYAEVTAEALAAAEAGVVEASAAATRAQRTLIEGRALEVRRVEAAAEAAALEKLAQRASSLERELTAEVEGCRAAEHTRADATARRDEHRAAADLAAQTLATAEEALTTVVARTGDRETLGRLIDAAERRPGLDARVATAESALAQATQRTVDAAAAATRLAGDAQKAADEATAALGAEEAARLTRDGAVRARDRLQSLAAATEQLEHERTGLAARAATLTTAAAAASDAQAARRAAEDALEALRRDHTVAGLVAGLAVGDPCPVCDRPLEEHPAVDPDAEQRLAAARAACTAAAAEHDRATNALSAARAQLEAAQQRVDQAAEAAQDDPGAEALAAAIAAVAAAEQALTAAGLEHERTRSVREAQAVALGRATSERDAAEREQELQRHTLDNAITDRHRTATLLHDRFGDELPDDALAQLNAARAELAAAETAATAARTHEQSARGALESAEAELAKANATLAAIDVRLAGLRTRAEGIEHTALSLLPESVEARDAHASSLAAWCATAATALAGVRATFDAQAGAAAAALLALAFGVEPALATLEAASLDAAEQRVRAEGAVAQLKQRLTERFQLEAQLAADAAQIQLLALLGTELKADHFIDFVVQETLDLLALKASDELLRISDRRYSLVSTNGQFSVIDHINADERRSVRTLSGGETFMASLALALALSKHVTELAGEGLGARLEAVFIDEGFGSLDPETLEEVIDALERLREEELIIGVISHVPTLAQRIRSGLEVRKEGNRSVVLEAAP